MVDEDVDETVSIGGASEKLHAEVLVEIYTWQAQWPRDNWPHNWALIATVYKSGADMFKQHYDSVGITFETFEDNWFDDGSIKRHRSKLDDWNCWDVWTFTVTCTKK